MALNLPKISAPTVGEANRLNPMKAPKAPKLTPFKTTTPKTAAKTPTNPYDTFNVSDPYAPGKINTLATSGYNTDVANANKLAAMGYLTPDQETSRAASQASNAQGIAQALQQQLAGIQTATVAQGNQGGSVLAGQNAATAAAGNPVSSALGVPNAGVTGAGGAQAVLGAQTAAGGNYLGSLQAAAASSGAQNAAKAYASGQSNIQTDQANIQKTLASLLSGVTPVSSRESTMVGANSQVDAANKQTELTIYTGIQNQAAQAAALGEKKLADQYTLQAKNYATTLSNSTKKALGIAADTTKTTVAGINAGAKVQTATIAANAKKKTTGSGSTAGLTPAQASSKRRQDLSAAIKIINTQGGTKTTTPTAYTVTVQPPTPTINGKPLPGTNAPSSKSISISPADYASGAWKTKLPKGYTVIGSPVQSKSAPGVINKPGSYTKYNRAASYLKSVGWSQQQIKSALKPYHP